MYRVRGGRERSPGGEEEDRRPLDSHPKKTAMCLGLEPQQPFMYVGRDTAPEAERKNDDDPEFRRKKRNYLSISLPYPLESQRREFKIHSSRFFSTEQIYW